MVEITIARNNFQEAVDQLFTDYGVQSHEILDFTQLEDGTYKFNVNKTIESEVELNNKVKSLIKSNNFSSDDIAFICSDSEVHTPKGGNLFERIKELVSSDIIPLLGFDNFITASNKFSIIKDSVDEFPVVYQNLILTKEGSLLKGSKFKKVRSSNSKISDPILELEISCSNPQKYVEMLNKATMDARVSDQVSPEIVDGIVYITFTMFDEMMLLDIVMSVLKTMPGSNKIKANGQGYNFSFDLK